MVRVVRVIGVVLVLVLSAALLGPVGAHAAGVPAAHADTAGPLSWSAPTDLEFASSGEPTAIACLPGDLCLVGDDTGEVLYSTDPFDGPHAWTAVAADATAGAQHAITGLACPTAGLCVAVDDAGGVLTTTDPTGPAGGWTRTPVDPTSAFSALSCVSATSCVAVDQAGDAWRSQSPAGGASAWTSAPTGAGGPLSAVSCPTTTFCAAVDHAGEVLTDTAPSPNWTVTKISSEPLNAVSCASATLCVAGGTDTGAIASSAPTGGAVAWHAGPVDPNWGQPESVGSVTCVEPTSCLIGVDEGLYETDDPIGGTWSDAEGQLAVSFDPIALSCVAGANCAGVDDEGNFGAGTSDGLDLVQFEGDAPDLNGVSCPTADRCFIDDDTGNILTATHPTGGLAAWPAAPSPIPGGGADGDGNEPYALACPSASLCLTGFGYVQRGDAGETGPELAGYSTAPTAKTPWHQFTLPPHHGGFSGVTCTTVSLCVAADDAGQLFASTHPSQPSSWHLVTPSGHHGSVYCPHRGRCLGPRTTCPTRGFCARLESGGTIEVSTAPASARSRWKKLTIDAGHTLTGIACASARLCYAVDAGGTVLGSTRPTVASNWSTADQAGVRLNAIACPTTGLCVAVGADGTAVTASRSG